MRCSMRFLLYLMALMMLLCVADPLVFAKDKESKLPPQYREWLDRDVAYIITRGEKTQFLSLTSDAERDKFIDWFWAIRNPDPESSVNAYKEEHYNVSPTWTITLASGSACPVGPQTEDAFTSFSVLQNRQATIKALIASVLCRFGSMRQIRQGYRPFFSVLFYKRDSVGDYMTYSPDFDGPQELITERGMTTLNRGSDDPTRRRARK